MKIILLQDVEKLGVAGDLVEVKDGYARNYLFPRKLAIKGTKDNLETWKEQKAKEEAEEKERVEGAEALKEKLESITITVNAKVGESGRLFGAITSQDIANGIKEETGEKIDKKKIQLSNNIKEAGSHVVPVRLYTGVVADLKVEVEAK